MSPNAPTMLLWLLAGAAVEALNSVIRQRSLAWLGISGGPTTTVGDAPPGGYGSSGGYRSSGGRGAFERRPSPFWLVAGLVLRLGMTSVVLLLAFRQGLASGLAALVGYWICRWVVVWRVTRRLSRHTLSSK